MKNKSTMIFGFLIIAISLLSCKERTSAPKMTIEQKKEIFSSTAQEDIKQTIWDTGDTTITNEDRLDLFEPHVKGVKGGYIGVGSTQNFSLAAWAQSEWVWLMDFTRVVVWANRVNIAFLKESETPDAFRNLWMKKNRDAAMAAIDKHYANDPELNDYKKAWEKSSPFQQQRFRIDDKIHAKRSTPLWLYSQERYNHIRNLALEGKIIAVKGDLRGPITVKAIAEAARKMGIVIRVAYYSNAEEYFDLGENFRSNWMSIPVDDKSVIVRTISVHRNKFPWAEDSHFSTDRGFHYAIQPALNFQKWLKTAKPGLRTFKILQRGTTSKEGFTMMTSEPLPDDMISAPGSELIKPVDK